MKFPLLNEYDEQIKLLNPEKPVEVYRNLHKQCWSVRQKSVRFHAEELWLTNVIFTVREKGRQRVLKEKMKCVHAFAKGYICPRGEMPLLDRIVYNPYIYSSFMWRGYPLVRCHKCMFLKLGNEMVVNMVSKKENNGDFRAALQEIARELDSIDIADCTLTESNIAEVLIEHGFMRISDRSSEVQGWREYVKV